MTRTSPEVFRRRPGARVIGLPSVHYCAALIGLGVRLRGSHADAAPAARSLVAACSAWVPGAARAGSTDREDGPSLLIRPWPVNVPYHSPTLRSSTPQGRRQQRSHQHQRFRRPAVLSRRREQLGCVAPTGGSHAGLPSTDGDRARFSTGWRGWSPPAPPCIPSSSPACTQRR